MKSIAILGFGVVGCGVAEVIEMNKERIAKRLGEELRVKKILDIHEFPDSPFASLVTTKKEDVFEDPEISIVVETIGGARIAYEYTKCALSAGKTVVTSNKELIKANAEARNSDMSDDELKAIAEKVGLGAVIYTYVKAGRERDIVFSWDTMLDFEGDTAPYLIYTYARTRSILRKAKEQGFTPVGSGSDLLNKYFFDIHA